MGLAWNGRPHPVGSSLCWLHVIYAPVDGKLLILTSLLYDGAVTIDFDDDAHVYTWREKGYPVDGVTTILKLLDKPAIGPWMVKSCVEEIVARVAPAGEITIEELEKICQEAKGAGRRLAKTAADIGTVVHKYAEDFLHKRDIPLPTERRALNGARAFLQWMAENEVEPIFIERVVMSRRWYYAGKLDTFAWVRKRKAIVDFKSSSGLYLEMILQAGGYAVALEEELGERIEDAWIVRLDKETGQFTPYHIPMTDTIRDGFLRVREAENAVAKAKVILDAIR